MSDAIPDALAGLYAVLKEKGHPMDVEESLLAMAEVGGEKDGETLRAAAAEIRCLRLVLAEEMEIRRSIRAMAERALALGQGA